MFSLFLSLLLFIYPSPTPLHFPPLSSPCFSLSRRIIVLRVHGSHLGRGGLFRDLLRLTIFFSPQIFLTQSSHSLLSCILSLFHSSFCLHRGMNFNHSALHLQSQPPQCFSLFPEPGHSVPVSKLYIQHYNAFSPHHSSSPHKY